jgi:hypothetical protein
LLEKENVTPYKPSMFFQWNNGILILNIFIIKLNLLNYKEVTQGQNNYVSDFETNLSQSGIYLIILFYTNKNNSNSFL